MVNYTSNEPINRRTGGGEMHGTLSDQSLIYLQIAQMLEDDILRGVYREEEQVPPPE